MSEGKNELEDSNFKFKHLVIRKPKDLVFKHLEIVNNFLILLFEKTDEIGENILHLSQIEFKNGFLASQDSSKDLNKWRQIIY